MVIPFKYELGAMLREVITGFKGVAMGRTQYFTGCNHYGLLSPILNKDGKPEEWQWFDETRLEQIGDFLIVLDDGKPTSGPHPNSPEM